MVIRREPIRKFIYDNIIVAFAKILLRLRGLVVLPLIVKLMGTTYYGLWIQIILFAGLLTTLAEFNLHQSLVRFIPEEKEHSGIATMYFSQLSVILVTSIALILVVLFLSNTISNLILKNAAWAHYIVLGAFIIPFECINIINLHYYRGSGRIKFYSIANVIVPFTEVLGLIFVLLLTRSFTYVLLFTIGIRAFYALIFTIHIVSLTGLEKPNWITTKRMLSYSAPLFLSAISLWSLDKMDRFFIGGYLGANDVGIYSACYSLSGVVLLSLAPFQITLLPKISELWGNNKETAQRYLHYSLKVFLILSFLSIAALVALSKPILLLLSNAEIAADSTFLTLLIGGGLILWGVSVMQIMILHGEKKTGTIGIIRFISAILNIVLNLLLIPNFGIEGAAIATLISYTFAFVLYGISGSKIMQIPVDYMKLLVVIGTSSLIGLFLYLLAGAITDFWVIIPLTLLCSIFYFIILKLLNVIDKKDIALLKSAFPKFKP
ncbi:MAG: oligosaccharide flippase family protein [bacterium]